MLWCFSAALAIKLDMVDTTIEEKISISTKPNETRKTTYFCNKQYAKINNIYYSGDKSWHLYTQSLEGRVCQPSLKTVCDSGQTE